MGSFSQSYIDPTKPCRSRYFSIVLHLCLLLLKFQPILVPFVTIPDVLCHCFKAMLLVRFYPNRALTEVYRDVFNQGRLLLF